MPTVLSAFSVQAVIILNHCNIGVYAAVFGFIIWKTCPPYTVNADRVNLPVKLGLAILSAVFINSAILYSFYQ